VTRIRGATPRSVVVAAVGDIAPRRLGDQGRTYELASAWNPAAVLVLGDLQYPDGRLVDMRRYYAPNWGRFKGKTHPVPGNHDYRQPGARGYFTYFGKRAKPRGHSYYSFQLNGWHIVALNSEISHGGKSAQVRWLRADLKANKNRCVLAYWHSPRFSSGKRHGPNKSVASFWGVLHQGGGDVVLNGHEHHYERFARQNPAGKKTGGGIREFVV